MQGKKFKPTEADRKRVKVMAAMGTIPEDICLVVLDENDEPICHNTLRRYFKTEMKQGKIQAGADVAQSLFVNATDAKYRGTGPQVTAAWKWLTAREGWSEKAEVENKGLVVIIEKADAGA